MITCQCPAAAALPNVPNVQCSESFGQIQKVVFQRLRKDDGSRNSFTADAEITKLESWEPLLTAADGTKVVITPFVYAPADSGGDARMTGGGNDDLGGIPEVLGANPVQFAAQLRAVPQDVVKSLKSLICEANAGNIGVFLIDENGNIEALRDETVDTTYYPIPVRGLFFGDKIHGNYDAKDQNALSWYYTEGYSDNLAIVKPEFNALTDLRNQNA